MNDYHNKIVNSQSIYDSSMPRASGSHSLGSPAPPPPVSLRRGFLQKLRTKAFWSQVLIVVGLITITLGILYGPMLMRQGSFWWRQRTTTSVVDERPEIQRNAIYPGDLAFFELSGSLDTSIEPIVPRDNRIVIDKIEVNAPIVALPSYDDNEVLRAIEAGVGHYPETASPGEPGNMVMTGHSSYWWWDRGQYKFVFQHLGELVVGDVITIYYSEKRYDYRVSEMREVRPSGPHVDEIFEQEKFAARPVITLITCTPVGTTLRRLIVVAELVEG